MGAAADAKHAARAAARGRRLMERTDDEVECGPRVAEDSRVHGTYSTREGVEPGPLSSPLNNEVGIG